MVGQFSTHQPDLEFPHQVLIARRTFWFTTALSSSFSNLLEIVIVVMLLWFGSMGRITHAQKMGHSPYQ
ncbi:MAG: hypothetical protein ACI9IV_002280 [Paracoccaceae bacterium]|jgi:hypothetical protein